MINSSASTRTRTAAAFFGLTILGGRANAGLPTFEGLNRLSPEPACSAVLPFSASSLNPIEQLIKEQMAVSPTLKPGDSLPILAVPSPSTAGCSSTVSDSVSLSSGAPAGYYCQVGCTNTSLLSSPTGSWPFDLSFATGSTYQSFTLTTGTVTTTTSVTIFTVPAGEDPTNSANWTSSVTLTIKPGG